MSSKRGGGQSNRGKNTVASSNFDADQLNHAVQDMNIDSTQDDGWEIISKKRRTNQQTPFLPNNMLLRLLNRTHEVSVEINKSDLRTMFGKTKQVAEAVVATIILPRTSSLHHYKLDGTGTRGQTTMQVNGQIRQFLKIFLWRKKSKRSMRLDKKMNFWWHCPACQNGPGAIDWYKSLQALITHAKTKGSKRVKIHRDLAELLEEELRITGAMVMAAGESYGQWKGLNQVVKDREIVWSPMVVIMNTQLEQDDNNNKWLGMGNQKLLDYFGSVQALRVCHSYGPRGHRGMSVLIFEASAVGYTEAERLSKHFEHQGTDRDAWEHRPNLFYPGGKRQLYGYMVMTYSITTRPGYLSNNGPRPDPYTILTLGHGPMWQTHRTPG
nr:protein suppressor of gene silencing 3 [Tanacetum cinerariifolium]